MNDQHDRDHSSRRLLRRSSVSGKHFAGLASRIVPLIVLAIGSLWWMTSMQPAQGQYPNTQSYNPRYQQSGQNYGTTMVPSIPSAAMSGQPQEPAATEAEGSIIPWAMPALVNKIARGGWLMIPLAICSLIVFALSLERLIALRRGRVIPRPFVRRFTECVEDGQLSYDEATELCEAFDCPVAEVFRAAVRRWGRPMLEVEQAVMDAGDRVADGLKRFLKVFHAISNVAPLLGLLGTVLGMIEAFEMMSGQESMGRPEMLASGISVALMTTAGGLSVAIPAYLAYMYFSSKSDNYLNEIDKLCQRVVDCISAEGLENAGSSGNNRKRRAA
jgi:biopolymer transport protein ExbB